MLYLGILTSLFALGWASGWAGFGWSRWFVGPACAYLMGATIRLIWPY
jgi:hypothetical protein